LDLTWRNTRFVPERQELVDGEQFNGLPKTANRRS